MPIMKISLILIIVVLGMIIDIFSCFLFIRRVYKGYGASGMPMVTLIVCYFMPIVMTNNTILTASVWLDLLLLLLFHIFVVYVIPIAVYKQHRDK